MAQEIQVVTASQIITFDRDAAADSSILRLEVDSRPDGLNAGKTSFQPGDSVGLLLYMSPNVELIAPPIVTAGSIAMEGTHVTEHTDFIAYAGDTIQTLAYPICNPALLWIGNNLGATAVRNCSAIELLNPPDWNPGAPDFSPAGKVGILRYEGTATAQGYRLTGTNLVGGAVDTPYQIGVYVFGLANGI